MDHQPPTANSHQPPTATNRQPPTATNRQPPTAANRYRRPTANRQPLPTATNHRSPTINRRQPPPTATNRQLPTANRQPPPTMVKHMECPRAFSGKLVTGHFFRTALVTKSLDDNIFVVLACKIDAKKLCLHISEKQKPSVSGSIFMCNCIIQRVCSLYMNSEAWLYCCNCQ